MNSVEVSVAGVDPLPWTRRCAGFVRRVLEARGIDGWEVSVLLCDDGVIRKLNHRYRKLDEPTDVLSFRQQDEGAEWPGPPGGRSVDGSEHFPRSSGQQAAGDVVISIESMRRTAAERGIPEEEELKRLLIHGILHLEGMDHPDGDEAEMLVLQEDLLASLKKERVY